MSASQLVELTIDGKKVSVPAGTTIFDAARMHDIDIPTLCNQQNEKPVGVCRVCVVDVGARVFAASCIRPVETGMVVNTASDGVKRARHTLVELLMSDHPSPCARERQSGDCELEALAKQENITQARYAPRATRRGPDDSSMSIAVVAASVAAATFARISCWDAWAKELPPGSLLTTTSPWANPPAFRAASAWFLARPARLRIA